MRVFVLLDRRLDTAAWANDYEAGLVPDRTPYGYHHAEAFGWVVALSHPLRLPQPLDLLSRLLTRIVGGDLVHALANARGLFGKQTDVIWTHTEREHLAVLLLRKFMPGAARHPIIAQSVWLADRWPGLSKSRRAFYRWLLSEAEVLTFLSTSNAALSRSLQLNRRIEVVPFGISIESFPRQAARGVISKERPIRLLALGNDMHRDWQTLSAAVANNPAFQLRVASSTFAQGLLAPNITAGPMTQQTMREAYSWADLVVIPLHPNLHASGITVLLEAIQFGLPVIVSDVGGLRGYFGNDAVLFVPANDAEALRQAIQSTCGRDLTTMVLRAQEQIISRKFTTADYAERHVQLSRKILGQPNS